PLRHDRAQLDDRGRYAWELRAFSECDGGCFDVYGECDTDVGGDADDLGELRGGDGSCGQRSADGAAYGEVWDYAEPDVGAESIGADPEHHGAVHEFEFGAGRADGLGYGG